MDTALPQKSPFILDRNLANANCPENRVCTSCDIVVLDPKLKCSNKTKCNVTVLPSHHRDTVAIFHARHYVGLFFFHLDAIIQFCSIIIQMAV